MKLYHLDCGWRGHLICVANSKEEAMKIFDDSDKDIHNNVNDTLTEHEIVNGSFIACWGDC